MCYVGLVLSCVASTSQSCIEFTSVTVRYEPYMECSDSCDTCELIIYLYAWFSNKCDIIILINCCSQSALINVSTVIKTSLSARHACQTLSSLTAPAKPKVSIYILYLDFLLSAFHEVKSLYGMLTVYHCWTFVINSTSCLCCCQTDCFLPSPVCYDQFSSFPL